MPHNGPYADLPTEGAGTHFKLHFYAAVLRLLTHAFDAFESPDDALAQFPFLAGYSSELAGRGLDGLGFREAQVRWAEGITAWEARVPGYLPLRALAELPGLGGAALDMLLCIGLVEEDARFGALFETLQELPGQQRPSAGLLAAWWPADASADADGRAILRRLLASGLVRVLNPDAPRAQWALEVPPPIWDALRGEVLAQPGPGWRYRPPTELTDPGELILPADAHRILATVPALLAASEAQALVVRGPSHNGRRTVVGAVARQLGRGLLEVEGLGHDDERWRLAGPLATLLAALPVAVLDVAPGETTTLPPLPGYEGPIAVVLGRHGGLAGPAVERSLTLTLPMPDVAERREHWRRALYGEGYGQTPALLAPQTWGAPVPARGQGVISPPEAAAPIEMIAERYRLTSGNIARAARLARAQAALDGRSEIALTDVQVACRALNREALETLAAFVPAAGDWGQLAVTADTLAELADLESRCRYRERLAAAAGPAFANGLTPGVRALFSGPSGTGKTLAARILAAALQKDLYRLDLASVVNKYIGETEKNLGRVFARAEELDVILLLDEGDALLTQRTSVQTSNDRYANLETNYLLQRLESFEGILIATTNAVERVDGAFQRRLDVVIDFHPPDVEERWAIWQLHLPAGHAVPPALMGEVAGRCELTGGQIRNAALHATLLALNDGGLVTADHLDAAVRREYRKNGAVCPLRPLRAW